MPKQWKQRKRCARRKKHTVPGAVPSPALGSWPGSLMPEGPGFYIAPNCKCIAQSNHVMLGNMSRAPKTRASNAAKKVDRRSAYREALHDMRLAAQEGVQEAIDHAHMLTPEMPTRRPRGVSHAHQSHALFDGITEALADAIIDTARPGSELGILRLVEDMLESKIQRRLCAGIC